MLLELKNISKRYGAPADGGALAILNEVNLAVEAGESVAIVGPSGSGKSTLLNIIGSLDTLTSGEVWLDGKNLAGLPDEELAAIRNQQIGFIFQAHHLLPQCTAFENVLIPALATKAGADSGAQGRAMKLLERVGLGERTSHRPSQLSGGECQRVAVVRALINKPKLLLADEPTGALDHKHAEELGNLLVDLNCEEKVALIVVTHWRELAKRMGKVYELVDGKLQKL